MPRFNALGIIAWSLALLCAAPVVAGTFNVVHDFQGEADGANPAAPLSVIRGRVYGTTLSGGSNGGYGTA